MQNKNNDDGYQLVTRKKHNKSNMRGVLQNSSCKIKVTEPRVSIYLSRASKSTTISDIIDHINDMNEECLNVELLKQAHEMDFCSFKVTVTASKLKKFLDQDFWPQGLVFRRFRERRIKGAMVVNNNSHNG